MTSAVPEAASEPEETVTLLLGREPKTEKLDVALSELKLTKSETLQGFLDCATTVNGSVIPLPDVDDAATMSSVLDYFRCGEDFHFVAQALPVWDMDGFNNLSLFALIRAADNLAVESLLQLTLATLGMRLTHASATELRERFSLPLDDGWTDEVAQASVEEPLMTEPLDPVHPTPGTEPIAIPSELLLRALATLARELRNGVAALRELKGVNSGMRSAVRIVLCRPDFQAQMFTIRTIAEMRGKVEAMRERRAANPAEPEAGWLTVGHRVVLGFDKYRDHFGSWIIGEPLNPVFEINTIPTMASCPPGRSPGIMYIEEIIEDGELPDGSAPLSTTHTRLDGAGLVPGLMDQDHWQSSDDEDREGPPALSIGPHYRVRWINGAGARDVMLRIHPALLAKHSFDTEKKVQKRGAVASALHHAVAHKDDAMIDFLLENLPQVHCEMRLCAEEAAKEGYLHGARRLLERMRATNPEEFTMADPYNLGSSRFGAAPLVFDLLKIAAAGNGRGEIPVRSTHEVARLLLDPPYSAPVERGTEGSQPLHLAAVACDLEVIRLLLERGANPTLKDGTRMATWRKTAVELAVDIGRRDVVKRSFLLPIIELLQTSVAARTPNGPPMVDLEEEWSKL